MFSVLSYSGAGFALILALGQLAGRARGARLAALLYACAGYHQFRATLYYSGFPGGAQTLEVLNGLHLAAIFALGPLFYFYLRSVMEAPAEGPLQRAIAAHFLPAAGAFAGALLLYLNADASFAEPNSAQFWRGWINFAYLVSAFHACAYGLCAFFRWTAPLLNPVSLRREPATLHLAAFGALAMLAFALALTARLFAERGLPYFYASAMLTNGLLLWTYLLQQAGRNYGELLRREQYRVRYKKSNLNGVDPRAVLTLLERIMDEEAPFRQEKLALAELAGRLDLTPHQLSEVINLHANCSYTEYLNRRRLRAACEALVRTPERSILDIGLDCGFGSRSNFNSVFVREIGVTPSQFRRNNSAGESVGS